MHHRLLKILLPALVAGAALLAAPTAGAATGKCIPGVGFSCQVWTGKVVSVDDGDTLKVKIRGSRAAYARVRVTGIQAMEQTVYSTTPRKRRGACHAVATTARGERLVRRSRGQVRLSARRAGSRTGGRIRRSIAVRIGGRWQDVGEILIREGRVLPLPNSVEYAGNKLYQQLADQASLLGIGIWNREACGAGPGPATGLRLWVNWDADGIDGHNINGEWIKIKNLDGFDLPVGGWWVRDSHLRQYRLPAGTVVPAGRTITVHVGHGQSDGSRFFWGQSAPVFENASYDHRSMGDGGYLFDGQGDLRAWMMYPCRGVCTDTLQGAIDVSAWYKRPEYVSVRNVSNAAVDLEGYRLENKPYGYPFAPGTVLAPGQTLTIHIEGSSGHDSSLVKHWGLGKYVLDDAGDAVSVKAFNDHTLDCYSWGAGRC